MKAVIVAGGTGGHIYPGIAVAEELERRSAANQVMFIGSEEGLEKELVPRAGFDIKLIRARALLRKLSYQALSAPFVSAIGFWQALALLKNDRPDLVLATGGYVSLPVVLAARALNLPIYLHEQNSLPGFSNRLIGRFARKVFLTFPGSQKYLNGQVTGNPVRREIIAADRAAARQRLGYTAGDKVVLIMGGSQGARSINAVVSELLGKIVERRKSNIESRDVRIMHIVGHRDWHLVKDNNYDFYSKVEYLYNMSDVLAAADLAVSRAGATAIAECLVRSVPMVLVPFPYSAEGHQERNARIIADGGAAVVVKNAELTARRLAELICDRELPLEKMKDNCRKLARPRAAEEIVNALA
ncbi:MAG TPA: undecaprenyldiphospho-muramoylpentapeptide beta-N-acetylglucosaminyltransferase [Candidatus Sulfotelmatobacter sp.]|nr:undecaprenyldiphospho-muramoylpentapeptide beta-N-acetylglucosaminyltransferase [Candidatus Sulfotelmatobacter sp.]